MEEILYGIIKTQYSPHFSILISSGEVLKIADFGISKVCEVSAPNATTDIKTLSGTLAYMAPELIQGGQKRNKKADVWSYGVIQWQMLTQVMPFQGCHPSQIILHVGEGYAYFFAQKIKMQKVAISFGFFQISGATNSKRCTRMSEATDDSLLE